jgi:hypothetical protein
MTASHHRRTYLVDRTFQLKYILLLMGWGVVLAALFGLWVHQAHEQAFETVVRDASQRALVARADRQLLWVLGAIGALSAAALGLLGFIVTHRVAGPVYVMGHYLKLLGEGRFPERRALRKHDELKGLYAHLGETMEALRARDERLLYHLDVAVARMRAALPRAPELGNAMESLEREARARRATLAEARSSATPVPATPAPSSPAPRLDRGPPTPTAEH